MDYTGFDEFPFPASLAEKDVPVKRFFLSLSDDEQLKLLNGSLSYRQFFERVVQRMGAREPQF